MELTDLLTLEQWKVFEKDIAERSGLDANVFDTHGVRITDHKKWVNRLCPAIKATDKGQSYICAVAHMNLSSQAKQTRKSIMEECDAGMVKIVVPIFVKNMFLGAVGACGLLLDDGEIDPFLINMTIGMDEEEIEKLSKDIDRISSENAQSLILSIEEYIRKIVREFEKK